MEPNRLTIECLPRERMLGQFRRFVESHYQPSLADEEWVGKLGVAAHELLENLIKYSASSEATKLSISLSRSSLTGDVQLELRTTNRATATGIESVRRIISEFKDDPWMAYVKLLKSSSADDTVSGLGIGRIRAEADMEVGCAVDGDNLTICCTATLPADALADERTSDTAAEAEVAASAAREEEND